MVKKPKSARWTVRKTRTVPAAGMRVPSPLRVQGAARIKRARGRPRSKPSAEEVRQLEEEWRTVHLDYLRQAKLLHDVAQDARPMDIPKLVRNLWCHTAVVQRSRSDPSITREDILGDQAKKIAAELASAGTVQKLAIDITLISEGWLSDSPARPLHVMILRDEYPSRFYNLTWKAQLFSETTHVAFESCLHEFYPALPAKGLKALFPRLRFCCIQINVTDDVARAEAFVKDMLLTTERLVVFMFAGAFWHCARDAPMWLSLQALTKEHSNLAVIPHQIGFKAEWEKLLTGQDTMWEAELEEDAPEKLPSLVNHDVDWVAGFHGRAKWHDEDEKHADEDPLMVHYQDAVDPSKGPTEKAQMIFYDTALPGTLTVAEELGAVCGWPPRALHISF